MGGSERQPRQGFTVIELLVVVIVIGILASAGVTKYGDYSARSRRTACIAQQDQLALAIRMAENELAPLASNTVLRLRIDGTISQLTMPGTVSTSATKPDYAVWLGSVPFAWQKTNEANVTTNNLAVRARVGDGQVFKCPEDLNTLGATDYTAMSNILTTSDGAPPGTTVSSEQETYTYAKNVSTARQSFNPADPTATLDPLEGYNWRTKTIEFQNSALIFCRRWGRRNDQGLAVQGVTGLQGKTGDRSFVPDLQTRLGHSSLAPSQ